MLSHIDSQYTCGGLNCLLHALTTKEGWVLACQGINTFLIFFGIIATVSLCIIPVWTLRKRIILLSVLMLSFGIFLTI
jgi:hypothetical protein